MKKEFWIWLGISFFVCLFGTFVFFGCNLLIFIPYQREIWHLICFIFLPIFFYLLISPIYKKVAKKRKLNPKCGLILSVLWFVVLLIIATIIEIACSKVKNCISLCGHILINLIGIIIFLIIYVSRLKKLTNQ
jgi:hypothetical protein